MSTIKVALLGGVMGFFALSAEASLVSTAGGLGVYDTVNNITWTSDANLMATQASSYSGGSGGPSAYISAVIAASGGLISDTPNPLNPTGTYALTTDDFDPDTGLMTWWGAMAWVNYLNVTNYAGSSLWMLPTTQDCNCSSGYPPPASSSQLAQLFLGDLGQQVGTSITLSHTSAYNLFSHVQSDAYWSGTEAVSIDAQTSWLYDSLFGIQGVGDKYIGLYALAVSPNDITAVPEPDVAWLLGSGLIVLGLRRRKAAAD